jgi:hypothetical protein
MRVGVVVVVAGLLAAGCGSTTVIKRATQTVTKTAATVVASGTTGASTAAQTAATGASTAAAPTAATGASAARQAAVGDTLRLSGQSGEALAVTVDSVMDPLTVGQFDEADGGDRYIGVQITLKNVGMVAYSDSPSNGGTLLGANNEQAESELVEGGPCGNEFSASVHIAPGDMQQGCLAFELSDGQSAGSFQFTLDSGFADQTGQWSLAGADTPGGAAQDAGTPAQNTATEQTTVAPETAVAPATTASDTAGPLQSVEEYWNAISAGDFSAAWRQLAPGVGQSEPAFVAGERKSHVESASFTGHVASDDGSTATVDVDSLVTHQAGGCTMWSGSYAFSMLQGQWLIAKAAITPGSCS